MNFLTMVRATVILVLMVLAVINAERIGGFFVWLVS